MGFPGGTSGKEANSQCRRCKRHWFNPWVGNIRWRRKWPPTPEFLLGESYAQRSLAGYSPWGHKELNRTKENSERDGNTRPPDLLPEKSGCKKQQLELDMEQQTGYKSGKKYFKAIHGSCCLFNLYAEYIVRNAGLDEAQAGIKIARRNISNLRHADITTLMASAAKSPQLCPTLCDPIDGSPPGSPVPGILQARTLEWVAISFSNA